MRYFSSFLFVKRMCGMWLSSLLCIDYSMIIVSWNELFVDTNASSEHVSDFTCKVAGWNSSSESEWVVPTTNCWNPISPAPFSKQAVGRFVLSNRTFTILEIERYIYTAHLGFSMAMLEYQLSNYIWFRVCQNLVTAGFVTFTISIVNQCFKQDTPKKSKYWFIVTNIYIYTTYVVYIYIYIYIHTCACVLGSLLMPEL